MEAPGDRSVCLTEEKGSFAKATSSEHYSFRNQVSN